MRSEMVRYRAGCSWDVLCTVVAGESNVKSMEKQLRLRRKQRIAAFILQYTLYPICSNISIGHCVEGKASRNGGL
jgi:hypothetical protein